MQRTNKALDTGLASLTKAQGAFLRQSWKPRQESEHDGFLHSRKLAGERERETKKTWGPKLWWSKGALMIFLWVYIGCFFLVQEKIYFLYKKIRKPNVEQPLPREQGINNGHKVRRQSISQERGLRLSSFVIRRVFTEGDPSLSHTVTSVPGTACCSTW